MNYYPPPPTPPQQPNYSYHQPPIPPGYPSQPLSPEEIQAKLMPAIITLAVVNVIGICMNVLQFMLGMFFTAGNLDQQAMYYDGNYVGDPSLEELINMLWMPDLNPISVSLIFLRIICGFFILFGCWRIYLLRNLNVGLVAAGLAVFPCLNTCCCLIDIPVGIWVFVLLLDTNIREAFVD